jgi:predicted dehydrogenase
MAPSLEDARAMVAACDRAGVQFMVHENFRWQAPMRALKAAAAQLGDLFFGRIRFRSAFDVYATQPYLAEDARFVLYDLGVHLLDLSRFFVGEPDQLYCQTCRVNPLIKGEDVATVLLHTTAGATCVVELSYASRLDEELFPQTLVHLEGEQGSATLGRHFRLSVTDEGGTRTTPATPQRLPWMERDREAIQGSVVAVQQHWTDCLREGREPETSGRDNVRTLELVFGAYESADTGDVYRVPVG